MCVISFNPPDHPMRCVLLECLPAFHRHRMVKSLAQGNRGAKAESRHSKAYIPKHQVILPLNLLYQRSILVWVSPVADTKTRI